jgi:hypothetical protein
MGSLKHVACEVGAFHMKTWQKLWEHFVTIVTRGSNIDPILLSKLEMFIKLKRVPWVTIGQG